MDVTSEKFESVFEEVASCIERCEFVAFDLELTGISLDRRHQNQITDSVEGRYRKLKSIVDNYGIIQFGLCPFIRNSSGTLEAIPYNFYVFPREVNGVPSGIMFSLEAGAIDFNRQHDMDFGKWITSGIPYLSEVQARELHRKLFLIKNGKKKAQSAKESRASFSDSEKEFANYVKTVVRRWWEMRHNGVSNQFIVPSCSRMLRLQIVAEIEEEIPELTHKEHRIEGHDVLSVFMIQTDDEKKKSDEEDMKRRKKEYESSIGFLRVFDLLVKSRKRLIGHNMLFDVLFTLKSFHGPLPERFSEFKESVHSLFPQIYDTKRISMEYNGQDFPENPSLGTLFEYWRDHRMVEISCASSFDESGQYHNAAFDAFCTGYCFAQFLADENAHATNFENEIYLMRSLFFVDLVNLGLSFWANNFFYVKASVNNPSDDLLRDAFSQFGRLLLVRRAGGNCAFVLLEENHNDIPSEWSHNEMPFGAEPAAKYFSSS